MQKNEEFIISDESQLSKLYNYWKSRLGLESWNIKVSFAKLTDEGMDDALGFTNYICSSRLAMIKICSYEEHKRDNDYYNKYEFNWDMERTLVHELLHIKFSKLQNSLQDGSLQDIELHQLIDELAYLLVHTRREEKDNTATITPISSNNIINKNINPYDATYYATYYGNSQNPVKEV